MFLPSDMAANKAVRWAEETEGNAALSGTGVAAPKKSAMKRNQSEDDILHSSAARTAKTPTPTKKKDGSPSGSSSDGEGSANRLRGYLEVKHNPMNGKGRSRLLRKVSGSSEGIGFKWSFGSHILSSSKADAMRYV